jgi:hypothetical protein
LASRQRRSQGPGDGHSFDSALTGRSADHTSPAGLERRSARSGCKPAWHTPSPALERCGQLQPRTTGSRESSQRDRVAPEMTVLPCRSPLPVSRSPSRVARRERPAGQFRFRPMRARSSSHQTVRPYGEKAALSVASRCQACFPRANRGRHAGVQDARRRTKAGLAWSPARTRGRLAAARRETGDQARRSRFVQG